MAVIWRREGRGYVNKISQFWYMVLEFDYWKHFLLWVKGGICPCASRLQCIKISAIMNNEVFRMPVIVQYECSCVLLDIEHWNYLFPMPGLSVKGYMKQFIQISMTRIHGCRFHNWQKNLLEMFKFKLASSKRLNSHHWKHCMLCNLKSNWNETIENVIWIACTTKYKD